VTFVLRDYQVAAVNAVWDYFRRGFRGNPIIALGTGTGKSLINAEIISGMVDKYPHTNILCLTHVKELIANNYATLLRHSPHLQQLSGVYSAGLKRREHTQINFAGIQSVYKYPAKYRRTNVVIIDECHLVGSAQNSRYIEFLEKLRHYNPKIKVIGLTATPFRLGMGMLVDGPLFSDVIFDITTGEGFVWMLDSGYLSTLHPKRPSIELDTDSIRMAGGEFVSKDVEQAFEEQDITGRALMETLQLGAGRQHGLIFGSSIDHVEHITRWLQDAGEEALCVHSKLPTKERDRAIQLFKDKQIRFLVNKDILTTGFDAPHIDMIVMLRPTQSPGLWVQMLGRGTRPVYAEGYDLSTWQGRREAIANGPKPDGCLVLDFVGNTLRLGPINYPQRPRRRGSGSGTPPVRECPRCHELVHIKLMQCPSCGYEFPQPEKIEDTASTAKLVEHEKPREKTKHPPKQLMVESIAATRHLKIGKPDSVKVHYYCEDGNTYYTWVGLDHDHPYVKLKAMNWWKAHRASPMYEEPASTDALLNLFDEQVRKPVYIEIQKNGKYYEITGYDFSGDGFGPPQDLGPTPVDEKIKYEDVPF
jgi:DNA repair protein RadD